MNIASKSKRVSLTNWFALCFLSLSLSACATYQGKVAESRELLRSGDAVQAAQKLEILAKEEGKDQLVYLLDYATALQLAGDFKKSTKIYLQADEMADYKDYHSVSKQTASLLLSQEMVQYKGDDHEKVLINAMLAYNFLMEGNLESAMVETRRINEKLDYYISERKKKYQQNVFAIYLGALIYEADRKWDDAYISYEKAYKIDPSISSLEDDLIQSSARAQRWQAHNKWKKQFGKALPKDWKARKNHGELVLVMQQGWGPRKYPRPESHRFPKLFPVRSRTLGAKLSVENGPQTESYEVSSVERISIKALDDDYASLVAKRLAGVVAKEVMADQLRQKDETLGALASIIMHASDRADLRQWSTLPQSFQVAKISLPPGKYKVMVEGTDASGHPTGEQKEFIGVEIKKRKKAFIGWRSLR